MQLLYRLGEAGLQTMGHRRLCRLIAPQIMLALKPVRLELHLHEALQLTC